MLQIHRMYAKNREVNKQSGSGLINRRARLRKIITEPAAWKSWGYIVRILHL